MAIISKNFFLEEAAWVIRASFKTGEDAELDIIPSSW
jgi:hypothetical protein